MGIDRGKQRERDRYYMHIASAVERGADCLGTHVGALVVLENRVISTGYNGTPSGFPNCSDKGCVRCYDGWLLKGGRESEMSDPDHRSGQALDRCVCVHAEQNAFITAARFGIRVDGATLYGTQSPCFSCLKEAVQAGVRRVVYENWYPARYSEPLKRQYRALAGHLDEFVSLGGDTAPEKVEGQPDPYEEEDAQVTLLLPADFGSSTSVGGADPGDQ